MTTTKKVKQYNNEDEILDDINGGAKSYLDTRMTCFHYLLKYPEMDEVIYKKYGVFYQQADDPNIPRSFASVTIKAPTDESSDENYGFYQQEAYDSIDAFYMDMIRGLTQRKDNPIFSDDSVICGHSVEEWISHGFSVYYTPTEAGRVTSKEKMTEIMNAATKKIITYAILAGQNKGKYPTAEDYRKKQKKEAKKKEEDILKDFARKEICFDNEILGGYTTYDVKELNREYSCYPDYQEGDEPPLEQPLKKIKERYAEARENNFNIPDDALDLPAKDYAPATVICRSYTIRESIEAGCVPFKKADGSYIWASPDMLASAVRSKKNSYKNKLSYYMRKYKKVKAEDKREYRSVVEWLKYERSDEFLQSEKPLTREDFLTKNMKSYMEKDEALEAFEEKEDEVEDLMSYDSMEEYDKFIESIQPDDDEEEEEE